MQNSTLNQNGNFNKITSLKDGSVVFFLKLSYKLKGN